MCNRLDEFFFVKKKTKSREILYLDVYVFTRFLQSFKLGEILQRGGTVQSTK
jgi:hypothetical protein